MRNTHICPPDIIEMFDNPLTRESARERASRWAGSLKLQPGDMIWMPEMGWLVRCDDAGDAELPTFH